MRYTSVSVFYFRVPVNFLVELTIWVYLGVLTLKQYSLPPSLTHSLTHLDVLVFEPSMFCVYVQLSPSIQQTVSESEVLI